MALVIPDFPPVEPDRDDLVVEPKVVALHDRVLVSGSCAENVVLLLEELLAAARSGEVVALAVAWVPPTGTPHSTWRVTEALHGWLLPGAVDVLRHRMLRRIAPDDGLEE